MEKQENCNNIALDYKKEFCRYDLLKDGIVKKDEWRFVSAFVHIWCVKPLRYDLRAKSCLFAIYSTEDLRLKFALYKMSKYSKLKSKRYKQISNLIKNLTKDRG